MANFINSLKNKFNDKYAFIFLSGIFALTYLLTYAKWGIIIFDGFHDYYVATVLMTGNQLYTDIAYLYPPLIPYLFKLLFTIFSPQLNILYIFGGITAYLFSIILYIITRQVLNIRNSILLVLLFYVTCAFDPGNKNYIFGYVAPAIFANLLALTTLLFVILHYKKNNAIYIYLCSLFTIISFLTKIEFAFAQLGLLIIYSLLIYILKDNRIKDCIYSVILTISTTLSIYFLFALNFGTEQVKEIIIPSGYLEAATFFHHNTLLGGITFYSILYGLATLLIFILIGSMFIVGLYYYMKQREKKPTLMLFLLSVCVSAIAYLVCLTDLKLFISENHLKLFAGSNFIVLISLIYFIKRINEDSKYFILIIISFFCFLVSLRSPLFINLEFFGSYYLPTVLIILFYFLFNLLPDTILKNANRERYLNASTIFIICLIAFFSIKDTGIYLRKNTLICQDGHSYIFVDDKYGKEMKTVLNTIKKNTNQNDKIFVLPEEVFYYVFSGRFAPGKFYYINPGAFGNNIKNTERLYKDLKNDLPKYIIISNLPRYEFGQQRVIDKYYKKHINMLTMDYQLIKSYQTAYPVGNNILYKINLYQLKE